LTHKQDSEVDMGASIVSQPAPASAAETRAHFARRLSLETDCADVHEALRLAVTPDFVLLDVRGPEAYAQAHVPGALNLPHGLISAERMACWPPETLFVVYCAGPHCNGAQRSALRLAQLQRPVKVMIGGMSGWREEGFEVAVAS
jgi:rhodanese-related sulfurtransferase